MRIDNSAMSYYWTCPEKFRLAFLAGLQKPSPYFAFGTYFHKLLELYYTHQDSYASYTDENLSPEMAAEVQSMFEAYKAYYPTEPFEVIECERAFELPIPGTSHTYLGKIDMTVRDLETKRLQLFETKTESRNSRRNLHEAWQARTQGSLYTWAASQLYGEPIDSIILNVCTKASPKGQIGPTFRRDILERTAAQVSQALRGLVYVCDQIENLETDFRESFPPNKNACVGENGFKCDFYSLCTFGDTEETRSLFVQVEPFAHLEM